MKEFEETLLKQSHNVSYKTALCVDEFNQNYIESNSRSNLDWNVLRDPLYTQLDVFVFLSRAYYFRMFKILVDDLIATGVMKHLVENYYTRKYKFEKVEEGPKVLSINDLLFGFNIWLGCCLISLLAFVAERITRFIKPIKKPSKIKFSKIFPIVPT